MAQREGANVAGELPQRIRFVSRHGLVAPAGLMQECLRLTTLLEQFDSGEDSFRATLALADLAGQVLGKIKLGQRGFEWASGVR